MFYPLLQPILIKAANKTTPSSANMINQLQQKLINNIVKYKAACVVVFVSCLCLVAFVQFDDNVKNYYSPDKQLKSLELRAKTILKTKWDLQYFLVEGKSSQALLKNKEKLIAKLKPLIENKSLTTVSAISHWLPSIEKQKQNNQLIGESISSGKFNKLQSLLANSNWSNNQDNGYLEPELWLQTYLGKLYQRQWVEHNQHFYSIVRLAGIKDLTVLDQVDQQLPQAHLIDKARSISTQISQFRLYLLAVLAAAILAALLVFKARYNLKVAILGLLTPVLALTLSLLISYFVQHHLTIFNLIAGILILALGLDYSVFYAEHGFEKNITLTTLMSALSSIFVFAILMFSSMPAIQSFGLTVFIGILFSFVLAPIVSTARSD